MGRQQSLCLMNEERKQTSGVIFKYTVSHYFWNCIAAEEDQEDIPDLSSLSAPMAKRPCQCCCQTYSEILSFLEKRSEAEQRLREDEFALRREEIEVQKSKTFRK